jgi:hypothetical protein
VKIKMLDPGTRESYWSETQCELRSARRRGDLIILAGTAVLFLALAFNRHSIDELAVWVVLSLLLIAIISSAAWIVATRKRRIAAARGLVCSDCSYSPHDTEIEELISTRKCPRCAADL